MKLISQTIGYICFTSPVGSFLFRCFLSFLYDVFWVVGFVGGLWKKYFGENK
jgi:hypothetical protein